VGAVVAALKADAPVTTARNSTTLAGWTLVSRATGLVRVVVVGGVLGPTYFANAFQAGSVVPNIVFTVIAGPVLAMVLVPGLVGTVAAGGLPRAKELLGRVTGWLLTVCGAVLVLLLVLSPVLAWTLTFGIPDPGIRARGLRLTTLLVVLVAPQLPLYMLLYLGMAIQQARGRFALAASAPIVENSILILTVVLAGWYYGPGLDMAHVPVNMVILLGLGSTIAMAVHTALQLFGAARVGLLPRPSMRWHHDPEARALTHRLARSVGVAAGPAAAMYVLCALAGSVPGGVFVIQLSYAVFYALSSVSSRAVSMAALPKLAHAAHHQDHATFGSAWRQSLSYAVIASLPLLVLLATLSSPIANILAHGQLHHTALIGPLATCLTVVAVAQLVGGLHDIARQALFARLDDRTPRRASKATFAVTLMAATASLLMPTDSSRLIWLVTTILIGELVAAGLVLSRLRPAIRPEQFFDQQILTAALVVTLAMVPMITMVWWLQHLASRSQLGTLAVLIPGGMVALGIYVLVLRATMRPLATRPHGRAGAPVGEVEAGLLRQLGIPRPRRCGDQGQT
jgi:putative peptidoglycan lipid II flippase